jgi:hypothetical protein
VLPFRGCRTRNARDSGDCGFGSSGYAEELAASTEFPRRRDRIEWRMTNSSEAPGAVSEAVADYGDRSPHGLVAEDGLLRRGRRSEVSTQGDAETLRRRRSVGGGAPAENEEALARRERQEQ